MRIQGIRETKPEFAEYLSKNYQAATGSFDLYVLFVELARQLIKKEGLIHFIMPVKWTNSDFGKGLRGYLAKEKFVSKIINFGAYQVFDASTYTGLHWFSSSEKIQYVELDNSITTVEEFTKFLKSLQLSDFSIIEYDTDAPWTLANKAVNDILRKLRMNPYTLGDIFDRIFCGLQTSKDDIYFLYDCNEVDEHAIEGYSKYLNRRIIIEKGLVKPLLKGEDVHRYMPLNSNRYVIFPYKFVNEEAVLYIEDEISALFPNGYNYLKICEPELRGREKGRFDNDKWFQFGRNQGIGYGNIPKLVAPEISLGGNYSYDFDGRYYSTTKVYGYVKKEGLPLSYEFLLGLLNSNLFWFFIKNTGYVLRGGYYTFKTNYVMPFPISDYLALPVDVVHVVENLVKDILKERLMGEVSNVQIEIDKQICKLYDVDYEAVCSAISI